MTADEHTLAAELESDVRHLAEVIGQRNMHTTGSMAKTAAWIAERMQDAGCKPERHTYTVGAPAMSSHTDYTADNIIAEIPGSSPQEIVVVGAHYDSVPGSPGANDNASAVAVLLALASHLSKTGWKQSIRLAAFANEEPPWFLTPDMGSYAYAGRCRQKGEKITAMLAMDGVGCFSDEPGSQHYPIPGLGWRYPKKGNFIGLVTRLRDRKLLRKVVGSFRSDARIPAEGAALPAYVPGVYWSDHWSFWQHDYPALLVTDTLPYRDPYYHTPADTAGRLDYRRMAQVAVGMMAAIKTLAE